MVVEPSELDSPFVLSSDSGERIVLLVMPTEFSYGSIKLAISVKGKNMYNKEELPRFVDHMRQAIQESRGSNNCAKQQHFGYSGNNRVEGPRILTVLTKDEVEASSSMFGAVKLLMEYAYEAIRKIGKCLQGQKEDVWNKSGNMIKKHIDMWQHANYVATLLDKTETCYKINKNIVGCLHTSTSIGSGLSKTHRDPEKAGWEWGGLPDFHKSNAER
jgi:hypothetical protein